MKHKYLFVLLIFGVFVSFSTRIMAAEETRNTEVRRVKPVDSPIKAAQKQTLAVPQKSEQSPENKTETLHTDETLTATPPPTATTEEEKRYSLSFESSPLDVVLAMYAEWAGRVVIKPEKVNANITLKAKDLTQKECMEAIETALSMNNIKLVPLGEKFLKVSQANAPDSTGEGAPVTIGDNIYFPPTGQIVTHIITLKHAEISEVQAAVQHLMHAYGKIQTLENINSLMITDTSDNIQRIRELISFLDQPKERIEPRIYHLQYADAKEVVDKLNEIVELAQSIKKKSSSKPQTSSRPTTPIGVIRARRPGQSTSPTQATITKTESSDAVMIEGIVKIMADERTNVVLIFSHERNFDFFDRIIDVLDVEVEPAVAFEVVQLEYANAEEISSTLNELLGSVQSSSTLKSKTSSSRSRSGSITLVPRVTPKTTSTETAKSLNKLSENTKVLADQRTNSLLLMGQKEDILSLKRIIANLDVMLEQVLIEAAIFEISLDNSTETGIQWFLRNKEDKDRYAAGWGDAKLPLFNSDGTSATDKSLILDSALSYYMRLNGINTETAIRLSKNDSKANLLSTPVIMTTDNTEATITVGEQRPIVTATETTSQSIDSLRSQYEYKDIGIKLKVTPHINPQKFVVMEILQTADQIAGSETIDGNNVPIIANREIEATVMVPNRGTIALGGLVTRDDQDTKSRIPILGDIPFIGKYLFGSTKSGSTRRELIVLLTPYVLTTPEEMLKETKRLHDGLNISPEDWSQGWTDSSLSKPPSASGTQELSNMLEDRESGTPENE